jgi:transcriptional regulator with XRE-family HTH domain
VPVGRELKRARVDRGVSLDEVAERTSINVERLLAIEREDLDELPSLLTVRGVVQVYADHVGLDPVDVSRRYVAQFDDYTELSEFQSEGAPPPVERQSGTSTARRFVSPSAQKTETRTESPWRPARFDAGERLARETASRPAGRILQMVDDRWTPPISGAPFFAYGQSRLPQRRRGIATAIMVAILAVGVGFTVAATLDRVRAMLEPQSFVQSPGDESPAEGGVVAVSRDAGVLDGGWTLTNRVPSNNQDPPSVTTIGYRVRLKQQGVRISGTGYRAMENGHIIPLRQRTPITVEGKLDGQRLELLFTERGAGGTTGGTWVMRVADNASLRGTFWSDATQSKGSALATRVAR